MERLIRLPLRSSTNRQERSPYFTVSLVNWSIVRMTAIESINEMPEQQTAPRVVGYYRRGRYELRTEDSVHAWISAEKPVDVLQ